MTETISLAEYNALTKTDGEKTGKREPPDYTLFYKTIAALGIEEPELEYKFHAKRRWRFDLCFVEARLALEVEGGIWIDGRHNRGSGFIKDMEKYNQAAIYGYHLLRATPEQMQNGIAAGLVEEFFKER